MTKYTSSAPRGILRAYPKLSEHLGRVPLLKGPSRVHPLTFGAVDGRPRIWIKRDDEVASPYGGNKPRKLEFLLYQARLEGSVGLLTTGAMGSNHCLATCLHGAVSGFQVHLVLSPQPVTDHVRKTLRLFSRHARSLILCPSFAAAPTRMDEYAREVPDLFVIPAGGSTALGTVGFVDAAFELAHQVQSNALPLPHAILLPAGTCGTLAGLVLGLKLAGIPSRVIGVRVVDSMITNPTTVVELARGALGILRSAEPKIPEVSVDESDFDLDQDQYGAGYGHSTAAGTAAIEGLALSDGISLEPTYSGKAMAGLIARLPDATPDRPLLFWNTFAGPVLAEQAREIVDSEVPPEFRSFL